MAGIYVARNPMRRASDANRGCMRCASLAFANQWTNGAAGDLRVEDVRAAAALRGVLVHQLAIRNVIGLRDLVRQAAVDQIVIPTAKLFAPGPVLGLRS